jgi:hypothetical protein
MVAVRNSFLLLLFFAATAFSQIDPNPRELIQVGYNGALEGHQPLSAYVFFYVNRPGFLEHTNLTLRMAIAPTYVDSELGFSDALGENTDIGIGVAGGGFADSYAEIREGVYLRSESFYGHAGEVRAALYHLFNPGDRIPQKGVIHSLVHSCV